MTAMQVAVRDPAVLALRGSQVPRRIGWLVLLIVVVGFAITVGLALGPEINVGVRYQWAALVLLGARHDRAPGWRRCVGSSSVDGSVGQIQLGPR